MGFVCARLTTATAGACVPPCGYPLGKAWQRGFAVQILKYYRFIRVAPARADTEGGMPADVLEEHQS
eukprot:184458-Chlamydomonas_euryale.AAC.2